MAYGSKTLIKTDGDFASREKRLSICLGATGFSFAETTSSGTLLSYGEADGAHGSTMTGIVADVKAFFASIGIRPLSYAASELVVVSDESVWVPDEIYTSAANRQYLKFVGSTPMTVMSCHCETLASTAVFAADELVPTAFKVAMPGIAVMNQHAKIATLAPRSANHPLVFTHWRNNAVDMAVCNEGRYIFGNTLRFANDNEALFHIVELVKSSGTDADRTELLMCGDVDRERFARLRPFFPTTTLFGGLRTETANPELRKLRTYRHALILM